MVVPHLFCPPPNNSALPLQQSQYSGFLLSTQSVATAQSLQAVSMQPTLDTSLSLTSETWASVSSPLLHHRGVSQSEEHRELVLNSSAGYFPFCLPLKVAILSSQALKLLLQSI